MKTKNAFPILSPGDPGYPQAIARAKRVFSGMEPGWSLADCDKLPDPERTIVIFRKIRGEVIALFPTEPGTSDPRTCWSYTHTGQHGAACASGHGWPLAAPAEFAPLKRELESLGYVLDVRTRSCPAYAATRRQSLTTSKP
jgi:hypothetical protein